LLLVAQSDVFDVLRVSETWKTDEAKTKLDPSMKYFVDAARLDHIARSALFWLSSLFVRPCRVLA
jgi:hypothetical protein